MASSPKLATSTPEGMAGLRRKFADAFGAAGLSGAETAVCYEESMNSGFGQSCRGCFLLSWLGYEKARVLHGGMQAWRAADLPYLYCFKGARASNTLVALREAGVRDVRMYFG